MKRIKDKKVFVLGIILIIALSFLTVAYAFNDKILDITGEVTIYKQGKLTLENVETVSKTIPDGSGDGLIILENGSLAIDYSFRLEEKGETDYTATYLITIFNDSHNEYKFTGFNLSPEISVAGATPEEATANITYEYVNAGGSNLSLANNVIPGGERRYLAVKFNIHLETTKDNTTIGVSGDADVYSSEDETGQFYGYLVPESPNLSLENQEYDCFDFKVLNTFDMSKTFSLSPGNNNFEFVDESGNALSNFTINAPSEDDPSSNIGSFRACIKPKVNAAFMENTATTSVILSSSGMTSLNIGTLNIAVNKTELRDEEKVHIGNVTFSKIQYDTENNALKVKASWRHLPDSSEVSTSVVNYYIQLYDKTASTTNPVYTFTVPGDATIDDYNFSLSSANYLNETNMVSNNHNYFIKVYAVDEAGNTGLNDCSSTSSQDYCVASSDISLKYKYKVTVSSTNNRVKFDGNTTTANGFYNAGFNNTLNVTSNGYTLSSSVTVTRGSGGNATTLTKNSDYTFSLNSGSNTKGTIVINPNVITDDITIAASTSSGACLVEGTKIKLANGTTKNIENIKYSDLIMALNHDTGKVVYEYPIWIEKKGTSNFYQITTFSDGSILKTVGTHGIYSIDDNEYVSVLDRKKFHVGTRVVKINDYGKKEIVKVVKTEMKHEKVNYYHVSSTYYHNAIADNILTTDDTLVISNMFPFNEDLTWTNERQNFLKKNDILTYDFLKKYFKYYQYKGFRMAETKYLLNQNNLDIMNFSKILGKKTVEPPKFANGKYKWLMTTSDEYNDNNSKFNRNSEFDNIFNLKYYEDGSYYTLPHPKNVKNKTFIGWYNTSDNKIYKPNDKIKVIFSMYFDAIWK